MEKKELQIVLLERFLISLYKMFKKLPLIIFLLSLITLISFLPLSVIAGEETAVFAGGCFWCLEHDLEAIQGVLSVESGYSGGEISTPTYKNHDGHQEVVRVHFDNKLIDYSQLLRNYWRNVDPLDGFGQFCDRGDSYRAVIFANSSEQKEEAFKSIKQASKELGEPIENIQVKITSLEKFWLAEDYHQDFAERNSVKYKFYRYSCGRDARLKSLWGKKSRTGEEWKR